MPIPYRKTPQTSGSHCAAYIDIIWNPSSHTFYGAILIIDSRGQPLEFVHNTLDAPSGFLWPVDQVRDLGVAALCRSLFEVCTREPEILVCRETLGSVGYCRTEIDPVIPFAQAADSNDNADVIWTWINNPPSQAMTAYSLAENLRSRGLAAEPFDRIRRGLCELYPNVGLSEVLSDTDNNTR